MSFIGKSEVPNNDLYFYIRIHVVLSPEKGCVCVQCSRWLARFVWFESNLKVASDFYTALPYRHSHFCRSDQSTLYKPKTLVLS